MLGSGFEALGGVGYQPGKTFWTEFKETGEGVFSKLLWWSVKLFIDHEKSDKGGSRAGIVCRKVKEKTE